MCLTCFFSPKMDIHTGQNFLHQRRREYQIRSTTGVVWFSWVCAHSLLHSQKAQQRLIRLFVQTQDSLPVLSVRLLLLQPIQSEERRVESREEQREQQRRAAHHDSTAT